MYTYTYTLWFLYIPIASGAPCHAYFPIFFFLILLILSNNTNLSLKGINCDLARAGCSEYFLKEYPRWPKTAKIIKKFSYIIESVLLTYSLRFWAERVMYWFYNNVCVLFFFFCVCVHHLFGSLISKRVTGNELDLVGVFGRSYFEIFLIYEVTYEKHQKIYGTSILFFVVI